MCNTTTPDLDSAIDTMNYDVQFKHLIDQIQDTGRRAFFLSEYLDACQIEDTDRAAKRKAAVLIAMIGVR